MMSGHGGDRKPLKMNGFIMVDRDQLIGGNLAAILAGHPFDQVFGADKMAMPALVQLACHECAMVKMAVAKKHNRGPRQTVDVDRRLEIWVHIDAKTSDVEFNGAVA